MHTGETVRMALSPAPAGTGIIFRVDGTEIKAVSENVGDTSYATTLEKGRVKVRTVEHLLAALAGLQVDNIYVDLSGVGSAHHGRQRQGLRRCGYRGRH